MCTDPMGLCVFAFFGTARLFKYWCVGLCVLKQERKSMCFLVHNPIAHVCGLRIWEGLGERHHPGDSGGFPGPAPALPAVKDAAFQEGCRELALERQKLPKQLADARLTLCVPRLASGEAVWSVRAGGVSVDSHTCVGPMGYTSVLSPNSTLGCLR